MAQAKFVSTDSTTQGTWLGKYGALGYYKLETASSTLVQSLPSGYTITPVGALTFSFSAGTTAATDLQRAANGSTRDNDCWHGSGSATITLATSPPDAQARRLRIYCLDTSAIRSQRIDLVDPGTSATLDTRTLAVGAPFSTGIWLSWDVSGAMNIVITPTVGNCLTQGVFLDASPLPARPKWFPGLSRHRLR